jgi:hypothetical protein
LLQDLLEYQGTTSPHLLATGLRAAASAPTIQALPPSILLIEDDTHCILSSATDVFFDITAHIDDSLLTMIGTTQPVVRDCRPMYLAGAVLGTGTHILINTATTYNDINIILGTLWLANLSRLTWDFSAMELQYYCDRRPISFTTVLPQHAPQPVLALPAPAPREQPAPSQAPSLPPRRITNQVSQISLHNALTYINTISAVFGRLCRAILQQQELHHIALAPPRHTGTVNNYSDNFAANVPPVDVTNETAAQAWSIHQGLLFLDGRLYTPATSPLQVDRLNALLLVRPANMRLPALYLHQPSTAPDNNAPPSAILLGRPGPQTITSPTTVIFLDALERQLLRVGSAHIPKALKEEPGLSTNIGGTATLTWSLDQVIIVDSDRYFYLQVPSSLCPHLLDSLHTSG